MNSWSRLNFSGNGCACLRRLVALIGFIYIYAVPLHAAISDYPDRIPAKGYCEFMMNQIDPAKTEDHGYRDYLATPFHNGALLLEFFGPLKNTFPAWLKWLESDDYSQPAPKGPGIYRDGNKLIIAKEMEYPIDGSYVEFSNDFSRKLISPVLEFFVKDAQHMNGSSPSSMKAREIFLKQLDTQLFGIYGAKKEDNFTNLLTRTIGQDLLLEASRNFRRDVITSPDPISFVPKPVPPNPLEDMKKVAEVIHEDDDNVVVRIDLGKKPENRNQEIIQRMFFITHFQMVQRSYRESRLFENKFETALLLLDDFIQSMKETNNGEQIFLMYPAHAWHTMVYRMNVAHLYYTRNLFGAGLQPYRYQRISDVFYPFYPTYGMIVEKSGENEFEMKRLFHNLDPDPLNYLKLEDKKTHKYFFYHEVGKVLPKGAQLLAISKLAGTTRGYKAIGFKLVESKYFEPWKCNKDILRMTLDEYLAKTDPGNSVK